MCLDPTYRFQGASEDEPDPGMSLYDPTKPNDFEQMMLRKRRIEKQLTTLMSVR